MTCIRHNYRYVNNRYDKDGNHVIEGGEWRTEKRCRVCDDVMPELVVISN